MGVFEDLHRDRITGSLAMYDRMIFKGRLTALYKQNGAKCFLWSQGVALKDLHPLRQVDHGNHRGQLPGSGHRGWSAGDLL
ncbi:MAG: hypothetical protein ACYCS7_04605 [Acidimicrobiales bacterium]